MWSVAHSYQIAPSEAWAELGRAPLSPRQRRRLTLAALELAALDQAFDDVTRRHSKGSSPDPQNMIAVKEMETLYNAARQPVWDRIAEECERALADAGELAENEHVAPFTGETFGPPEGSDEGAV